MNMTTTRHTIQSAAKERQPGTTYVAFGFDHSQTGPAGLDWWLAGWSDDDGPTTPEVYVRTRIEALAEARSLAETLGVKAVEVDEFGPKP